MIHNEGATAGREEAGEISTRFAFFTELAAGGGCCWFSQQIHCARSILNTGLIFCLPHLWAHILFISREGKGQTVQFLTINIA